MIQIDFKPLRDTSTSSILGVTTEVPLFVAVCGVQVECIRFINDRFTSDTWDIGNANTFLCGSVYENSMVTITLNLDGNPVISWVGEETISHLLSAEFISVVHIKVISETKCFALLGDNSILEVTRNDPIPKAHVFWADLDLPGSAVLVFDVMTSQFESLCTWTVVGMLDGTLYVMRRYIDNSCAPSHISMCVDGPIFSVVLQEYEGCLSVIIGSQGFVSRCTVSRVNGDLEIKSLRVLHSGFIDSVTAITTMDIELTGVENIVIGTSSGVVLALSSLPRHEADIQTQCEAVWEGCILHKIIGVFCVDLNHDGLDELVVVSGIGLHVFTISPSVVSAKLEMGFACLDMM